MRTKEASASKTGRRNGQGLVEFALALPVVLLILVAAVDVGRLFSAYVTVENAAKEGALFGANKPGCTAAGPGCLDPNNLEWHVTKDLNGLSGTTITATCIAASDGSSKPVSSCLSGDSYQASVTYPFTFLTPIAAAIIGPSMSLSAHASALVTNAAFAAYTPTLNLSKNSTTAQVTAAGQVVPYTYLISNSSNASVTGITATDNNVDNPVSCPQTSLAAGVSMTCTAQHTVTAADMSSGGSLSNIVTVTSANAATVSDSWSIPIQGSPPCTAPTVSFSATPTSGSGGSVTVTFTGTSSGSPTSWLWTFGDGTTAAGSGLTSPNTVQHTYQRGGKNGTLHFNPKLTVTTGATCSTTASAPSNNYITLSP